MQYVFAEKSAKIALGRTDVLYDPDAPPYQRQDWCFRKKQWTAMIGAAAVLLFMGAHGLNLALS